MNKLTSVLLGSAVAVGLAVGAVAPASAETEITYWQYSFGVRVDAIDSLIEQFEAASPDIQVNHVNFPYADYRVKVGAAIPAGEGPDVVQLFYGWLDAYREAGLLSPLPAALTGDVASDYFPMVSAMEVDGEFWGLPTAVRSLALFYNTDLFEEAGISGPPETLDELENDQARRCGQSIAGWLHGCADRPGSPLVA